MSYSLGNTTEGNTTIMYAYHEQKLLQFLSDHQTHMARYIYSPTIAFLVCVAFIGLIGNLLVLAVYLSKFKLTATRFLILAMAATDLFINLVVIPIKVLDFFHDASSNSDGLCRVARFIDALIFHISLALLLSVAFIRYMKVCQPFRLQVSVQHAKALVVLSLSYGLIFSVPYAILMRKLPYLDYPTITEENKYKMVTTYVCATTKEHIHFLDMFFTAGMVLSVLCSAGFLCFYLLIGIKVCQHKAQHGCTPTSSSRVFQVQYKSKRSCTESDCSKVEDYKHQNSNEDFDISDENLEIENRSFETDPTTNLNTEIKQSGCFHNVFAKLRQISCLCSSRQRVAASGESGMGRTTGMLIAITAIFIFTYIPNKCLIGFDETSMGPTVQAIYILARYLFFLNSATNPVIYSLCDARFRKACLYLVFRSRKTVSSTG